MSTTSQHRYHAEAHILKGNLKLPIDQVIEPQGQSKLCEKGGYLSHHAKDYSLEGAISFKSGYTQVSGKLGSKDGHGPATLATSVVEGLNVFEILTADRVVAQIATEHPLRGHVPEITFLGTRFENLRIAGHPVHLNLHLDALSSKPAGDAPYTKSQSFVDHVRAQYQHLHGHADLPREVKERYKPLPEDLSGLEIVDFSLVNSANGPYPGKTYGHVLDIPHFGKIYLGVIRLKHQDVVNGIPQKTTLELTMVDVKMGCLAEGFASFASLVTNGENGPVPPTP